MVEHVVSMCREILFSRNKVEHKNENCEYIPRRDRCNMNEGEIKSISPDELNP